MGLDDQAVGGIVPSRLASPTSPEEVAATVREASERGEAVVPFAGRTRIDVGNAPARYDVALDLRGLSGVVEYQPGDLTITVRAGTTLAALRQTLSPHGQMWPVEGGRAQLASVGGVLAGAAAGPSRLRYGHPRDWAIGVRAVLGDGRLTRAGGKVVKNVTGYDLTRFYAGSYGTLCVLVEASLKLWALPEVERTLVARFRDLAAADDGLATLRRDGAAIDAVASLDLDAAALIGEQSALAAVRLRGTARSVDRLAEQVRAALAAGRVDDGREGLWDDIADVPHRASVVLRVTAPEGRMHAVLRDAGPGVLRYAGTGLAFLVRERAETDWIRARRSAVESEDGACVIERCPRAAKADLDAWGRPALPSELARRLKAAFDPRGTLSPGRFAGGL